MATVIRQEGDKLTIEVTMQLSGSMLEMEEAIRRGVNEVGSLATREALSQFDATGAIITVGDMRLSSKGKVAKEYETPYGTVEVARHVYQSAKGGKTFCPLDERARIVIHSTPQFAKMIAYKYASLSAREVCEDLAESGARHCSRGYVQKVADYVGMIAIASEEHWEYEVPKLDEAVATISVSLDGTCILMKQEGYREAMTGTLSLYDALGERLHTVYVGASPEYGKQLFLDRLQREVDRIKQKYPDANTVGIADGASSNWKFLEKNTEHSILDFYHATEYLAGSSYAFASKEGERKRWLQEACHRLKHEKDGAKTLLQAMQVQMATQETNEKETTQKAREGLEKAVTYFTNQCGRMDYAKYREACFPIGSGVTEAACKTLIKQRLCRSAMQWKDTGAKIVISIRSLVQTTNRWKQFWNKINQNGFNDLAII